MIKKITLGLTAAVTALTALPAAAEARHRDGYYDQGRYEQRYRGDSYRRGDNYYGRNQSYNGRSRYDDRYDGRSYGRRCSGTTGTIIGAIAGGLLGDAAVGRRGDETAGAIVGGAIGALAGRAIDKGDCRR